MIKLREIFARFRRLCVNTKIVGFRTTYGYMFTNGEYVLEVHRVDGRYCFLNQGYGVKFSWAAANPWVEVKA